MVKIINGRKYSTDTAKWIGNGSYSHPGDFDYWSEDLYRKKTGEFFIHGEGGARSRYSRQVEQNTWSGSSRIVPITIDEAKAWCEKYLDAEKYIGLFGDVEE